jgi:hypothetical protein
VAGGGRAVTSIEPPRFWPIELGLSTWAATTIESELGGANISSLDVSLGLCPEAGGWDRLGVSVCLGAIVDRISAQGVGLDHPQRNSAVEVAAFVSVRLAVRVTDSFYAHLGLSFEVPFFHARFIYRDSEGEPYTFYETPPAMLLVELGLAMNFFFIRSSR